MSIDDDRAVLCDVWYEVSDIESHESVFISCLNTIGKQSFNQQEI